MIDSSLPRFRCSLPPEKPVGTTAGVTLNPLKCVAHTLGNGGRTPVLCSLKSLLSLPNPVPWPTDEFFCCDLVPDFFLCLCFFVLQHCLLNPGPWH